MENLSLQKVNLENLIEEKLKRIEELQKELVEAKENVEVLQEELNNVNNKIKIEEELEQSNQFYQEEVGENSQYYQEEETKKDNFRNKRKNMEDFVEQQKEKQEKRKRRRQERFQDELISEKTYEEEEIISENEQEELFTSFKKACEEELKGNQRIIKYWAEFGLRYEERMIEKVKESRGLEISEKEITEEINEEIKEELSEEFTKNFKRKIIGARKSKYIIDHIGIGRLGKISIDVIRDTPWKEIKERILAEEIKKNKDKIREVNENQVKKLIEFLK